MLIPYVTHGAWYCGGGMRGCEACGERGLRLDVWLGLRVRCTCVLRVGHGGNQSEIEADNSADGAQANWREQPYRRMRIIMIPSILESLAMESTAHGLAARLHHRMQLRNCRNRRIIKNYSPSERKCMLPHMEFHLLGP